MRGFYHIEGSKKYKYVSLCKDWKGRKYYAARLAINGTGMGSKKFQIIDENYEEAERKAAVFVDKQLLEHDREPVNILIRKQS